MKKLLLIVMLVVFAAGCRGSNADKLDPQLYQSVPGSTHGGETYQSDKIIEPNPDKRYDGPLIW